MLERREDVLSGLFGLPRSQIDGGEGVHGGGDDIVIAGLLLDEEPTFGVLGSFHEMSETEIGTGDGVEEIGLFHTAFFEIGEGFATIVQGLLVLLLLEIPLRSPEPHVFPKGVGNGAGRNGRQRFGEAFVGHDGKEAVGRSDILTLSEGRQERIDGGDGRGGHTANKADAEHQRENELLEDGFGHAAD